MVIAGSLVFSFGGGVDVVVEYLVDGVGVGVAFFHPSAPDVPVLGGVALLGAYAQA